VQRILDEQGTLVGNPPEMDDKQLVDLYRAMITAREFDERVLLLQRTGRVPAYYQSSGQEASAAAGMVLAPQDWVVTAYREQPIRLARGVPIDEELAVFFNAVDLTWDPLERRITPLNATIGSHIPHATGLAYAMRYLDEGAVALAVFGDGATSEGDFHAGMNFAGVWNAPVVFYCQNNQYAQSTPLARQTRSETIAQKAIAYGFDGVRVDGMDALAVYDALADAVEKARTGGGPTLVEAVMYRYSAHSTYDGEPVYRTRDEEAEWLTKDPLLRMGSYLASRDLLPSGFEDSVRADTAAGVEAAIDKLESVGLPGRDAPFRHVYSAMPAHLEEQLHAAERIAGETPSVVEAADRLVVGEAVDPEGETTKMTMVEALRSAIDHALRTDERVVVLGEDVGVEGGVFRVTSGLYEEYGSDRLIDTPLSEVGILGSAVGMAMGGLRPVAELEFAGLGYTAFDQIVFHAARYRWRTRSKLTMPIVVRLPGGGGHEGYEGHSDNPENYFVHAPGLIVVYPSNPRDAKGLMAAALESEDPVVFFEPVVQYFVKHDDIPIDHYTIPLGKARIARPGEDVTIVAYGNAVGVAERAAEELAADQIDVEVIDLRTLKPWDRPAVLESVTKTGRLVVVHEAPVIGGFGAEIVATVAELAGDRLETPPIRIGHPDMVWGQAKLEAYSKIVPGEVVDAVRRVMED
jgi:pyruvate/2-oxoglutarate/acetoin dehydrogenase E1 component/TPP-dependent pyruvate/acetoin dehydrogenase alpha subunit